MSDSASRIIFGIFDDYSNLRIDSSAILEKKQKKDMELNIKDRLFFANLLPDCKSFLEFNLKRGIMDKVAITDEDKVKYEIVHDPETNSVQWNPETDMKNPLVVKFSDDELALIKRGCESLDGQAYPDDFWRTVEKVWNAANN